MNSLLQSGAHVVREYLCPWVGPVGQRSSAGVFHERHGCNRDAVRDNAAAAAVRRSARE